MTRQEFDEEVEAARERLQDCEERELRTLVFRQERRTLPEHMTKFSEEFERQ